jgi:hypothetical protein
MTNSVPASTTASEADAQTVSDQVHIQFDWATEIQDGHVTFQVGLRRGERHNAFDVRIDLSRLQEPELERLQTILVRRQSQLSDGPEIAATIRWLLELALIQQGFGPEGAEGSNQ